MYGEHCMNSSITLDNKPFQNGLLACVVYSKLNSFTWYTQLFSMHFRVLQFNIINNNNLTVTYKWSLNEGLQNNAIWRLVSKPTAWNYDHYPWNEDRNKRNFFTMFLSQNFFTVWGLSLRIEILECMNCIEGTPPSYFFCIIAMFLTRPKKYSLFFIKIILCYTSLLYFFLSCACCRYGKYEKKYRQQLYLSDVFPCCTNHSPTLYSFCTLRL